MARQDRVSLDGLKNHLDDELNDERAEILALSEEDQDARVSEMASQLVPVMNYDLALMRADDLSLGSVGDLGLRHEMADDIDAFKIIAGAIQERLRDHADAWLSSARGDRRIGPAEMQQLEDLSTRLQAPLRAHRDNLIPWQRLKVFDDNGLQATPAESHGAVTRLREGRKNPGLSIRTRLISNEDLTDPREIDWHGFVPRESAPRPHTREHAPARHTPRPTHQAHRPLPTPKSAKKSGKKTAKKAANKSRR